MKKTYFAFLLLGFIVSLVAQSDISTILKPAEEKKPIIEQLKTEKKELAILEEEISYYYSLLQQRKAVRELYKKGKISSLKNVFSRTAKIIDRMFETEQIKTVTLKIGEQKIIYGDIVELQGQLLYYRAKLSYVKGNNKKAQNLLEDIVKDYPHSPIMDSTILLLEEIYFLASLDQELIDVFDLYKGEISLKQNYWLAQALYNTGNYTEAESFFNVLQKDKTFAFRSKSMLALISYFTEDLQSSIDKFSILEKEYNKGTDYYEYVIISLARLNLANGDFEIALSYYDEFYELTENTISDELIYEIAMHNYNNEKYPRAIEYFNIIIERPDKSQYFASAKFFVAVSEQGRGNYDQAENTLTEMISKNNILMETMNTKYDLLEKYSKLKRRLVQRDVSDEEYNDLKEQCGNIEKALGQTNGTLEQLYTGLDSYSLDMLKILEEEYMSYSSTIADMEAVILLAESLPNKRIPAILDREIASSDSSIITLQVLSYLGHRPRFSSKDFNFAKALATEKIYQENLLITWEEIEQIAIQNNHEEMLPSIQSSQKNIRENLESIGVIAQYMFKGKPSDDFQELIKDEAVAIDKNKIELMELKKDVIKNFNKLIARRLSNEKELMISEFEHLQFIYDDTLSELMGEITSTNAKYQFSLLSILFKQTQIMDKEYKEFQEKVKNE
ncbi:MAG: tetratricopeptide repeat protein [Candidatus Tenebribacter davisii]|nr:tetratricopeptide repeat protein [Candidatus Tenebribacter davisii]